MAGLWRWSEKGGDIPNEAYWAAVRPPSLKEVTSCFHGILGFVGSLSKSDMSLNPDFSMV